MRESTRVRNEKLGMHKLDAAVRATIATVGIDLGDRMSRYAAVNGCGDVVSEGSVATRKSALEGLLSRLTAGTKVVIEVGTHSPWISRLIRREGFEVKVVNPRSTKLISGSTHKNDRRDASILATIGQSAPQLLKTVEHQSEQVQLDRALLRARDSMVRARARLIVQTRGIVKAIGGRIKSCSADAFATRAAETLPESLHAALDPVLIEIERLTVQIHEYDRLIHKRAASAPACGFLEAI